MTDGKTSDGGSLRDQLIGAWKLVSYEERPVDGSPSIFPMTQSPLGLILYTPDGFMSAQLSAPDREGLPAVTGSTARDDEYRREASTYIAYSGRFEVDEQARALTHSMFVSFFPNWRGQTQPRVVRIENGCLHLSTDKPIMSGGRTVMSYLVWARAATNS